MSHLETKIYNQISNKENHFIPVIDNLDKIFEDLKKREETRRREEEDKEFSKEESQIKIEENNNNEGEKREGEGEEDGEGDDSNMTKLTREKKKSSMTKNHRKKRINPFQIPIQIHATTSSRRWIDLFQKKNSHENNDLENPNYFGLLKGVNWKSLTGKKKKVFTFFINIVFSIILTVHLKRTCFVAFDYQLFSFSFKFKNQEFFSVQLHHFFDTR